MAAATDCASAVPTIATSMTALALLSLSIAVPPPPPDWVGALRPVDVELAGSHPLPGGSRACIISVRGYTPLQGAEAGKKPKKFKKIILRKKHMILDVHQVKIY